MDMRQLECFLKVAEHLHFGRAAEDLYLGQPAVSEAVRRLEREIGGALFDRTTRRVTITPLGAAFLEDARAAYDGVRRAYERAQAMAERQTLAFDVGYSGAPDERLLRVVAELQRRLPGVVVSLRAMPTPRLARHVRDGRLHVAIGWTPEHDDALRYQSLGFTRLMAVVPRQHEYAMRESVSLHDIAREPLIGWPRAINPVSFDRFAQAMDATGAPWTLVGTTTGPDNVAARVLSGFGIAIGFESLVEVQRMAGLAYVPLSGDRPVIHRMMFWRADAQHPALSTFNELVVRSFGAELDPAIDRPG
jgi:DNA-binding transcriptional LysR family regulator